jgi:hypothetical protein
MEDQENLNFLRGFKTRKSQKLLFELSDCAEVFGVRSVLLS